MTTKEAICLCTTRESAEKVEFLFPTKSTHQSPDTIKIQRSRSVSYEAGPFHYKVEIKLIRFFLKVKNSSFTQKCEVTGDSSG